MTVIMVSLGTLLPCFVYMTIAVRHVVETFQTGSWVPLVGSLGYEKVYEKL